MAMIANKPRLSSGPISFPLHPYQYDEFANRDPALELIGDRVRDGRAGRFIRQPVVLFWGVHGVGKSWLLCHFQRLYAFSPPEPERQRKGVFTALADFKDFAPGPAELTRLLSRLVEQIADHLGEEHLAPAAEARGRFEQAAEAATAEQDGADSPNPCDVLAARFVEFVASLTPSFVPLLLFDTMGQLESRHRDFFLWFEEQVIAPIIRGDQAIVILASRRELRRWRQFEVRRRVKTMELGAFDPQETVEQFRKGRVRAPKRVGEVIYPYSRGHPLATWHLQESLERLREEGQRLDRKFVAAREQDVARLLAEVEEWLLQGVPRELCPRLALTATLRRFHIKSLQLLLADLEQDEGLRQKPDSYFQDLIAELVATNLARWSSQHHNYILDPTVRRIMNRRLLLQDSAAYRRRQEAAFQLYTGWVEEMPWNCGAFLVEALYHLAARAQADALPAGKLREEIDGLLAKALQADKFDLEGANELAEELPLDDELREALGRQFEKVLESVEGFRQDLA
jgi:hypothetical protein